MRGCCHHMRCAKQRTARLRCACDSKRHGRPCGPKSGLASRPGPRPQQQLQLSCHQRRQRRQPSRHRSRQQTLQQSPSTILTGCSLSRLRAPICQRHCVSTDDDGNSKPSPYRQWWLCRTFAGLRQQKVVRRGAELDGGDLTLTDLEDCTVLLLGRLSALRLRGARRCCVVAGPVAGAAFLEGVPGRHIGMASLSWHARIPACLCRTAPTLTSKTLSACRPLPGAVQLFTLCRHPLG